MKLRLNINGGSMEDIVVLQNILNNYDVRVDVIPSISYGNEIDLYYHPYHGTGDNERFLCKIFRSGRG